MLSWTCGCMDRSTRWLFWVGRARSRPIEGSKYSKNSSGEDSHARYDRWYPTARKTSRRCSDDVEENEDWCNCTLPEVVRLAEDRQTWKKLLILSLGSTAHMGYECKTNKKHSTAYTRLLYATCQRCQFPQFSIIRLNLIWFETLIIVRSSNATKVAFHP